MLKMQTPTPALPDQSTPPEDSRLPGRSATSADGMVGRRIKELRRRNGLTQKEVASRIGVTGAQFHRYEVGTTRVAASRLVAIATALGVRPADLVRDDNPQEAPRFPAGSAGSNDLMELVEVFSGIADQRRRGVLMTFARSLATATSIAAEAA